MSYEERAGLILKDAIKSAIYIDEKARSFYDNISEKPEYEEELSVNLYNNFKQSGISLEVYKFSKGDEQITEKLEFITENRDFVILDWKLDGNDGEEESLKILSEIVLCNHIHFSTIYTSEENLDDVIFNLLSYFSKKDKNYYLEIGELLELEKFNEEIITIFKEVSINRFDNEKLRDLRKRIYQIDKSIPQKIQEITGIEDLNCAIIKSSIALDKKYQKSERELPCPTHIDFVNKIIVINNTIITILQKKDNNAENLLENFKNHIIRDFDSFNQLLGIELFNNLYRSSSITSGQSLSFSKDALVFHRKKLKEEGIGYFFNSFMDEVMIEKIAMSLRNRESLLLNDDLLDDFESNLENPYQDLNSLHKMNVFYNSFYYKKENQFLNFGDVLLVEKNENHKISPKYLICLTPLCDCLRPQDKIKGNFFFAEGTTIRLEDALELGDTAFISYLPNNITIKWTEITLDNLKKSYSPLYIKPIQYKVLENQNTFDDKSQIKVHYLDKNGQTKSEKLFYLGTIRNNYAQRIANHAFSYPIRVGVDFVKK
jgi:hypothetical protein